VTGFWLARLGGIGLEQQVTSTDQEQAVESVQEDVRYLKERKGR
jgi:hypothetical protein